MSYKSTSIYIDSNLKKRIMRRVYLTWFFKKLTNPITIETISCMALILWLATYISFMSVWENAHSIFFSPVSLFNFIISSFGSTELISKLLILSIVILIILMIKKLKELIPGLILRKKEKLGFVLN